MEEEGLNRFVILSQALRRSQSFIYIRRYIGL